MEKVVLAYSGGLDTSVILKWLALQGYQVIAYVADVGQKEDFEAVKAKALKTGASKVYVEDLKREFVSDYIFTALKGSAVYEGRYLLGTSIARPIIAKRQIDIARAESAKFVSHGATGKGNDQVRFELSYQALEPGIGVIAPWKDQSFLDKFKGRTDLLNFAKENGIAVSATLKAPYSIDANLMHSSYEAGCLEDPKYAPPKEMFQYTVDPKDAPDQASSIAIEFVKGIPHKVHFPSEKRTISGALELFEFLNQIAGKNGVGRIDIVENRYVGIKSRGVYESPAATVLWAAHQDLETLTLDREVLKIKNGLSSRLAEIIYNGYWFSPEMEFLKTVFDKSQETVNGTVYLDLYKGNVTITGRESPNSLYDAARSSMDQEGGFNQQDSKGFININAVRLAAYTLAMRNMGRNG